MIACRILEPGFAERRTTNARMPPQSAIGVQAGAVSRTHRAGNRGSVWVVARMPLASRPSPPTERLQRGSADRVPSW